MKTKEKTQKKFEKIKKEVIRVLSVDPGITNMGICIGEYNRTSKHFTVLKTINLQGAKHRKRDKLMRRNCSQSFCVLSGIKDYVLKTLLPEWSPDYIACEGAFHNHNFPGAHQALVLVIHILRECAFEWYQDDITDMAPMTIKKIVTGKGNAPKELIKTSIMSHTDITLPFDINTLTEHEIDAIAHGYAFCRKYIPSQPLKG